jgi:uncharacterized protein (DUF58 family)
MSNTHIHSFSLSDLLNKTGVAGQDPEHRIKIRPTAYGWGLLFLLIWTPFTALATANNFLLIVFIMLLGTVLASHILAKRNVRSVTPARRAPEEIYADTPFSMKYIVKSSHPRWGSLTVKFKEIAPLESSEPQFPLPPIPPSKTVECSHSFTIKTRGVKELSPGTLESTFPFGMALYAKRCGQKSSVLVFPKVEPIDGRNLSWIGGAGLGREKVAAHGTVPFHFREYVAGDPYKRIDWKKTAQLSSLTTRVPAEEEARHIIIRLPSNASERAISMAASLVKHFERMKTPISLYGPGIRMGPGYGEAFTRKALTALALWDNPPGEIPVSEAGSILINVDDSGELNWERD